MLGKEWKWINSGDADFDEWVYQVSRAFLIIAVIILLFVISSCSSTTEHDVEIQKHYFEAKARQAEARSTKETQALLDIECDGNCNFKKLKLSNPFAKQDAVVINRPLTTREVDGQTVTNILPNIVDGVLIGAGIIGATKVLGEAFKNNGGSNTNNNNYGTGNLTNTSTNTSSQANGNVTSSDGNTTSGDVSSADGNNSSTNNPSTVSTATTTTEANPVTTTTQTGTVNDGTLTQ